MADERWSYQVIQVPPKAVFWPTKDKVNALMQDELNRLGALGWDLVAATPILGTVGVRLFLKKAK